MYYYHKLQNELKSSVLCAIKTFYPSFGGEVPLGQPRDTSHGDFASNIALMLAKPLGQKGSSIAEQIIANLEKPPFLADVEVAGAGFINFHLKEGAISRLLDDVHKMDADFGKTTELSGKKIMVEFVSANPTGPMHMGNARGGALGDSLATTLSWCGADVTREFYVNDTGAQIEKFRKSLEVRFLQQLDGESAHQMPQECYMGEDIRQRAAEYIEKFGPELDGENLCRYALETNISAIHEDLQRYGIIYDVWFRESTLYADGTVNKCMKILEEKGKTYEKEGAIWLKCTEFGSEKDEVLVRANGFHTYFAADIAYHYNKFAVRGFDKSIEVWGADHHGHVARLKGALDLIGGYGDRLEVVLIQLVRLMRNGETVRMSKRTGKAISLIDLIEETSRDAARFYFNLRASGTHMEFDLDLAVQNSNDNPVFYVQYAHARICSIIRNLAAEGAILDVGISCESLVEAEETALIKKIGEFTDEIVAAAKQSDPSRLTKYSMDLAALFHTFYANCRVKGSEQQGARLKLVDATRIVLRNCLGILGVSAPERM